eukprot:5010937-Karenia_brevis.AAC.1
MARWAEELSWPVGDDSDDDEDMAPAESKGKGYASQGMTSAKANDPVVSGWPDADAAAGNGVTAPTEDDLLDDGIAEEILKAFPNLDAG